MKTKLIIFSVVQNRNLKQTICLKCEMFCFSFVIFVFQYKTKHILKQKIRMEYQGIRVIDLCFP